MRLKACLEPAPASTRVFPWTSLAAVAKVVVLIILAGGVPFQTACAEKGGDKAGPPAAASSQTAAASGQTAAAAKPSGPLWEEVLNDDLFNGKAEDTSARFFQSPDFQKLLVLPSEGDNAYILALKLNTWSAVPMTSIVATSEDGAAVAADAPQKSSGTLVKNGADLLFTSGINQFRVSPEKPIIGLIGADALLKKKGDYAAHVRAYQPKTAALALIRSETQPVLITVFFGTWCSYCKRWLPEFIKTIQTAANPNISVQYFGVDEGLSQPEGPITQFGISRTPTIVVMVNGKELGRIIEQPKKSMEEDLALILMGAQ